MSKTLGRWEGQTPFTDAELFLGPSDIVSTGTVPISTTFAAGQFYLGLNTSLTYPLWSHVKLMLRTGQLATSAVNQEQFGTAALQPGPSAVANTTDPLALPGAFAPWANAVNPAITGGVKGPIPKGYQVNWVDVIYTVVTANLTSITAGLYSTKWPTVAQSPAAQVTTTLLTLGAYGFPLTVNANWYRVRLTPTVTPTFQTGDGAQFVINVNVTTSATSICYMSGWIVGITYNYA